MALPVGSRRLLFNVRHAYSRPESARLSCRYMSAIAGPTSSNLPGELRSEIQVGRSIRIFFIDANGTFSTLHHFLTQTLLLTQQRAPSYARMPPI